ncbi:MAG: hypothetical protein R3C32_10735 [Chloroflexota bacterium]
MTVGFHVRAAIPRARPSCRCLTGSMPAEGRIRVVPGPNGAGKTTLLRTVAGVLPPLEELVRLGANVTPGYLAQIRDAPIPGTTVLDAILNAGRIETAPARTTWRASCSRATTSRSRWPSCRVTSAPGSSWRCWASRPPAPARRAHEPSRHPRARRSSRSCARRRRR